MLKVEYQEVSAWVSPLTLGTGVVIEIRAVSHEEVGLDENMVIPGMRILLVDDEPVNVQSLANALRKGGHDITTLSDPREALLAYRDKPFPVVISDIRMPGMSGIDLLKAIRAFDERARVILITGYGDAEMAMAAMHNRAWAMLAKPIRLETVMDMLDVIEREDKYKNNSIAS